MQNGNLYKMGAADEVLKKLPKQTPLWAVGLVTIIVATSISGVVFYTAVKAEIRQYLTSSSQLAQTKTVSESSLSASMLKLIEGNSTSIVQLSSSLAKEQEVGSHTRERVATLEKELAVALEKLKNCETELGAKKK